MQKNNYTPGPWNVHTLADDPHTYGGHAGMPIITTEDGETEICGVVYETADADLIAAAPDMLAALKLIACRLELWVNILNLSLEDEDDPHERGETAQARDSFCALKEPARAATRQAEGTGR